MERTEPALAESLAREAAQLKAEINAAAPDVGKALTLFGRAATVSLWASMAAEDVRPLDEMVALGSTLMRIASKESAYLFPPAPDLLDTMVFTAWCHLERFSYRLDIHDLDEANRYACDTLKLPGDGSIREDIRIRAECVAAEAASRRFEINGDRTLLDDAVIRLDRSLALQPDATAIATLAKCLRQRACCSDGDLALNDLNRAGGLLYNLVNPEAGLPIIPIDPVLRAQWLAELGLVHFTASRIFGSSDELGMAREWTRAAVESWPQSSAALFASAQVESTRQAYSKVLRARRINTWVALQAALGLMRLAVASAVAADIVEPAKLAWDILQQAIANQVNDKHKVLWLSLPSKITAVLAPALAATGSVGAAVKYVEEVRTRVLEEHFPDEERELFELGAAGHQNLSAPIRRALDTLRNTQASPQNWAQARNELAEYVRRARQLPGFASFRLSPDLDQMRTLIEAPLIYLVPGNPAGVALVVLPNGASPVSIPLPGCPMAPPPAVERFLAAAFSGEFPPGARRRAIDAVSTWSWDSIYEPLRCVLTGYPFAHFIGGSYLALVPFHAARARCDTGWRYAINEVELRYAPSARALAAARRRQLPEREPKFLIIPQPTGAGPDLDGARSEVNEVAAHFAAVTVLAQKAINPHGVRQAIGGVGWLHAACHGVADPKNPLTSGLLLANHERFSITDLFKANRGHLLVAVLSACQTNVPDVNLPDEATSLATGLLIGGCRAVIASAWQVPDPATSALMQLFYHCWRRDGQEVSAALRKAQLTFTAGGGGVDKWRSEWADPYFWAGFSYLGP